MREKNFGIPDEESLSLFFKELGKKRFWFDGGTGRVIEPYLYDVSELDRMVMSRTRFDDFIGRHFGLTLLEHHGSGSDTYVDHPFVIGPDGTKYAFETAWFVDGYFDLRVKVTSGMLCYTDKHMRLSEIRKILGKKPPRRCQIVEIIRDFLR